MHSSLFSHFWSRLPQCYYLIHCIHPSSVQVITAAFLSNYHHHQVLPHSSQCGTTFSAFRRLFGSGLGEVPPPTGTFQEFDVLGVHSRISSPWAHFTLSPWSVGCLSVATFLGACARSFPFALVCPLLFHSSLTRHLCHRNSTSCVFFSLGKEFLFFLSSFSWVFAYNGTCPLHASFFLLYGLRVSACIWRIWTGSTGFTSALLLQGDIIR